MRISVSGYVAALLALQLAAPSRCFQLLPLVARLDCDDVTTALAARKPTGKGFGKGPPVPAPAPTPFGSSSPEAGGSGGDPVADLSGERRANLFHALLRDLQIQGTPLLAVDADRAHTFQAAVWTTLAELCDDPGAQTACLVFECIPVEALRPFVEDFMVLKTQVDKTAHLPEVQRISLSLVGKGAGPAILVEVANETTAVPDAPSNLSGDDCMAAMKSFLTRMVIGEGLCPHVSSSDEAPSNLPQVAPRRIDYSVCPYPDVPHILSSFWNAVCALYGSPDAGTAVLLIPSLGMDARSSLEANHARFAAVAELLSRYLCLFRGDGVYELLHFHPHYTRDWLEPRNRPAHGHLPPTGWLRPMLRHHGDTEAADALSDDDLRCSDYQRRSPLPAVCIKRVEDLDHAVNDAGGLIELDVDGSTVLASGVPSYARNTVRLARLGPATLEAALAGEMGTLTAGH